MYVLTTVALSWVAALLQPVGDKRPALVVQPHDALLLLLAQPQLEDLPAVRVDRVLRTYEAMNFHVRDLDRIPQIYLLSLY